MYGTIFRIHPPPGQEHVVRDFEQRWLRERALRIAGFIAAYTLISETHPGEWLGLVIFDSRENYQKNANDPEQDRWYREFRSALEADPEWNDGEIVALEREVVPL